MTGRIWSALGAGVVAGGLFVAAQPSATGVRPVELRQSPVAAPAGEIGEAVSLPMAPCEYEDGPGPCVWRADVAGNGVGYSFWIDCEQVTHYFDPEVERELARAVNAGPRAYDSTCE